MPELPDIEVYLHALHAHVEGETLKRTVVQQPFLLRTYELPVDVTDGFRVVALKRIGKRIAIGFENDIWHVVHLMIAGRLHWKDGPAKVNRNMLACWEFPAGTLWLTEAGKKRRASLQLIAGSDNLSVVDPQGLEVLDCELSEFASALRGQNRTLKRALTCPRLFAGIGNAYSDEILHAARLSPLSKTQALTVEQTEKLFLATRATLTNWRDKLLQAANGGFPKKVTAFHPDMAVHGRFGQPCPVCNSPVQRIQYADNETNYCATCQTGGTVYADRALSRLLKNDWPRRIEDWEA